MSETPEKKYWRSPLDAVVEGPPILPLEDLSGSRRSFLRLAGFGLAAAATAGCSRGPVQKAIPYLVPPEEIVPGRAYWLATTCAGCPAACGMLAKGRDGRPVKLEGNPEHPVSHGGLCAVGQASLLSLYDSHRLDGPRKNGQSLSWKEADASMRALLKDSRTVRILTGTIHGPSTLAAIGRFLKGFPDGKHVMYDPLSVSAILDAHKRTHGVRVLPRYRFDSAEVIAAFGADFLGTWISPVEFSRAYARGRDPDGNPPRMSRHWHFEARMSLTGSRADRRIQLSPWDTPAAVSALCALLEKKKGVSSLLSGDGIDGPLAGELRRLADELWEHRGKALMVCGSNDVAVQVLVNHANDLLGNYGTTLDLERPSRQRQGDDAALAGLRSELAAGKVDALIIQGVNPGFDLPDPERFAESLRKTRLVVSCSAMEDETSSLAGLVCPEPHFLESWNDGEPLQGTFTLTQPSIPPLRKARTLRASLEVWAGGDREDLQIIRDHWEETIYPEMGAEDPFSLFFDRALQAGFIQRRPEVDSRLPGFQASAVKPVAGGPDARQGEFALVLYPKVGIHDGRHAHNPWLQELPDPVTKTVWDNYACFSVETARALGIRQGDVVRLVSEDGKTSLELPAFLQPGQHDRVVAVALGYGRMGTDRFAKIGPQWWEGKDTLEAGSSVGRNAAPFLHWENDTLRFEGSFVKVEKTGRRTDLACTQDYHSLHVPKHLAPAGGEVREAIRETTLAGYAAHPAEIFPDAGETEEAGLWKDDHPYKGHHWGMVVDLSACTGCSACVIGCQAENNVPVVGKDEVKRHREMSWIRIDRYYSGKGGDVRTAHQPMMCQHCDNAPCETVCPVLATVHSREGINQQIYNRCVGTRFCANNCPYKVRRFNWFDYAHEDRLQNMTLNPDVTIRSRGVMEKCSLCIQRIQEARFEARRQGRDIRDGEIQTACQQSCPTSAIHFGDMNDPGSLVSRKAALPRSYAVLGELNVRPSVHYQAVVRNSPGDEVDHGS